VLCAQVQRDCVRLGLLDDVLVWVRKELATAGRSRCGLVADALDRLEPRLQRSLRDAGSGAAHFRRQLDALVRAIQAASLLHEAAGEEPATGKAAAAALFVRRHLAPGYVPDDDPSWGDASMRSWPATPDEPCRRRAGADAASVARALGRPSGDRSSGDGPDELGVVPLVLLGVAAANRPRASVTSRPCDVAANGLGSPVRAWARASDSPHAVANSTRRGRPARCSG